MGEGNKFWVNSRHKTGFSFSWIHFNQKFPLYVACEKGHMDIVRYLLGPEFMNFIDVNNRILSWSGTVGELSYSETALHVCSRIGNEETVKLLLEYKGIQVWRKDHKGKTAEDVSKTKNIRKMIEMKRLGKGAEGKKEIAEENEKVKEEELKEEVIVEVKEEVIEEEEKKEEKVEVDLKSFIKKKYTSEDFYGACKIGDIKTIHEILEEEKDENPVVRWVNDYHVEGLSLGWVHFSKKFPLYVAAENGRLEIVEILLGDYFDNIIDVNRQCSVWTGKIGYMGYSDTSLHAAARNGHIEIVKRLLNYKGIKILKNRSNKTPSEVAEVEEIKKMIEIRKDLEDDIEIQLDMSYLRFSGSPVSSESVPIVYRDEHNISFFRIEEFHSFDSKKFQKIAKFLIEDKTVASKKHFVPSMKVTNEFLEKLHTKEYLEYLSTSKGLAAVVEFYVIEYVPFFALQYIMVNPMLYQVGGTILAGELAMRYGWGINLGGGMHHCRRDKGGGWCAYGDIQLCIMNLREKNLVKKVMIVDLDAHQGNGYERDKSRMGDIDSTYIFDYYVHGIYPSDGVAARNIDKDLQISSWTTDKEYNETLEEELKKCLDAENPDLVFYNAGTDIMSGDPLGGCNISAEGIIKRDCIVWKLCFERNIPIVMVTSGGYQKSNGRVIASSITNLNNRLQIMKIAKRNYIRSFKGEKLELSIEDDEEEEEGEEN